MNLKEFIENELDCKINENTTEDNLKEFLNFMKVECCTNHQLIKYIYDGVDVPLELLNYIDSDRLCEDYCYIKVNDDCYVNEYDLEYFKESKYDFAVEHLNYNIDKFIKEYNDAMNDENFQDDFDLFPF